MSMEDLKRLGVLLDEKEWSPIHAKCRLNVPIFIGTIILSLIGCWMMIAGNGGRLTWLGLVLFLVGLFSLIIVNLWGVKDVELNPAPSTTEKDENASKTE